MEREKLPEEEHEFDHVDYEVEFLEDLDGQNTFDSFNAGDSGDTTALLCSEPGPSNPAKRRKTNKPGNRSVLAVPEELLLGSMEKDKQYCFKGVVYEKKFKNQKSFERCGNIMVSSDYVDDVLEQIWQYCTKFIYRGVIFPDTSDDRGELKWEDPPMYKDCDKFMTFHDKVSKRNIAPSKVDGHALQNWLTKDVTVILYKYSDAVSTLQKWNLLESQLLRSQSTDRAGAESITSLNEIKEELKDRHGRYLSADDVNWGCWANWICSKPLNMRDDLMRQTPPQHIIGLFSTVPVHSDVLLAKARLDMQVASTVNNVYVKVLHDLKEDHQQLVNITSVIGQRISMLQEKQVEYENMLTAMNSSISVRENKFSVELAQSVTDSIDVDHE
ncbi:uncharacterized protein LOC128745728 [Sabethes cyaneus]|uniref:uncharacterized protein LOC128745728 n=1 Tax=Sabethes cyaneus TaxID=53552 RepID=UPI00237E1869|nr:uncharacterized protein LOC128745728 [Sabethes cyaneus]